MIKKVQVRYYDECRDPYHQNPLAVKDLALLPAADQSGFAAAGGGRLWALPSAADPTVGDKSLSFGLRSRATAAVDRTTCRSATR